MEFLISCGSQSKLTNRFPVTGQQGHIRRNIHVNILFTAEKSILDRVDRERNGARARLIEIKIDKEKKDSLFNDYKQCREIERFLQKNYGTIVPLLMKEIFIMGIDEIENMVIDKQDEIRIREQIEENILSRYLLQFAILEITADIAKKIGLNFEKERITSFLIETIIQSLSATGNKEIKEYINIFQEEVIRLALGNGVRKKDGTYIISGEEIKEIIEKTKKEFPNIHVDSYTSLIEELAQRGIIKRIRGKLSSNHSCNNKQIRGYCVKINEEKNYD